MNNSICTATVETEKNGADKKTRLIGMLLLPLLLLPCAANATIYKCVVADSTIYSATPCSSKTAAVVRNTVSTIPSSVNSSSDNTDANHSDQLVPQDYDKYLAKYEQ